MGKVSKENLSLSKVSGGKYSGLKKFEEFIEWGSTSHQPSSKSLQTVNTGEGMEKRNPSTLLVGMWIDTTTMKFP